MNRMIRGVDYSFARPNLKKLYDLGYRFVGRYATGRGKALTRDELHAIWNAGLALGPLYMEPGLAARARMGRAVGEQDALAAKRAAADLGLTDIPIFMVDDANSTLDQVRPYFIGAGNVLGKGRRGAYGSGKLLRQLRFDGLIDFAVETGSRAWGDGTRDPNAEVLQDPPITVAGGDVDVLHADASAFAAFRGGWKPEPPPPPRKYASRTLTYGAKGADVRELQRILSTISAPYIRQDGDYGHETEKAKHDATYKLGWSDTSIKAHDASRDIGVTGQEYLLHPDRRPKAYKDRERKRAGR
jgi:hypothetical protein